MLTSNRIYQHYVANKELTPKDIAALCRSEKNVIEKRKNKDEICYTFADDSVISVLPHCIHSFENEQSLHIHRQA